MFKANLVPRLASVGWAIDFVTLLLSKISEKSCKGHSKIYNFNLETKIKLIWAY